VYKATKAMQNYTEERPFEDDEWGSTCEYTFVAFTRDEDEYYLVFHGDD
jgi:hypothetical protein